MNTNYKKGTSGNPGGRPKSLPELRAFCQHAFRKRGEAALNRLLDDEDSKVRLKAWELVLSYGFGKPSQELQITQTGPAQIIVDLVPHKEGK